MGDPAGIEIWLEGLRATLRANLVPNLIATGVALGLLGGCLVLLHTLERAAGRVVARRWGWRGILVTGWIGVPVHELSHLLMAHLFSHRIIGWSLFDPDPATGTLGYVRHAYRRRNLWQLVGQFFIGIAPVLGGTVVLGLLMWSMVGSEGMVRLAEAVMALRPLESPRAALGACWQLLSLTGETIWTTREPWLVLQLYACVAVSSHIAPSRRDVHQGGWGALATTILIGIAVAAASMAGISLQGLPTLAGPLLAAVLLISAFVGIWVSLALLLSPAPARGAQLGRAAVPAEPR